MADQRRDQLVRAGALSLGYLTPRSPPQALPRPDRALIDILAAETAMTVTHSLALLRPVLDQRCPALGQRVVGELERRLWAPVLAHDDWFWQPAQHNWSVWIASAVLGSAGLLCSDRSLDLALLRWVLQLCQRFCARYGEDGACDEGPGYWGHAAGSLLLIFEILHDRTQGRIDGFADDQFRAMCGFIETMRLSQQRFATVAHCPPLLQPPVKKIWHMGERLGDNALLRLAQNLRRQPIPVAANNQHGQLSTWLRVLCWTDPRRPPVAAPPRPLSQWLPSRQILIVRSSGDDGSGVSLAAKAGSNDESHNYNDVGQLIVYAGSEAVLINPGVGRYHRQHLARIAMQSGPRARAVTMCR